VQIRGQWVEVDPATWKKRKDFNVTVGYAAGNKDAMVQRLMMIASKQIEALQLGVPVCTPQNYYETQVEITKASDFTTPERFWTDPAKMPAKPPPPPDPLIAQAQIKAQADGQKAQLDAQVEQLKLQQQEIQSQRDNELKKYVADLQAQVQLLVQGAEARHQRELEILKGEHNAGLAAVAAALDPKVTEAKTSADTSKQHGQLIDHVMQAHKEHADRMEKMIGGLHETMKAVAGPKKAIRGKDGKIESVVPA
jgi:hypothetical protein